MKILLAIENSDFSEAAVQMVLGQFRPDQTEVYILNVIDPLVYLPLYNGFPRDLNRIDTIRDQYKKEATEIVQQAAGTLRGAGYQVTDVVDEGEPRTTIVDCADRIKANLIVVGSHGRRGLPRLLLGSVSDYVARHANCSVEIVRRQPPVL